MPPVSGGQGLTFESIPASIDEVPPDALAYCSCEEQRATHSTMAASLMYVYKNIGVTLRCVASRCDRTWSRLRKNMPRTLVDRFFFSTSFFYSSLSFSSLFFSPCHPFFLPTWVICISDVAWRFAGESAASIPTACLFAPSFVRRTSRICAYALICVCTLFVYDR